MSVSRAPRRERSRPRRRLGRPVAVVLGLIVIFAVGLALGEALHDNPSPGKTQTLVRTLKPLEVPPAPETVTVTVGG